MTQKITFELIFDNIVVGYEQWTERGWMYSDIEQKFWDFEPKYAYTYKRLIEYDATQEKKKEAIACQQEIERLKGLIEKLWFESARDVTASEQYSEWNRFRTSNNL